MYKLMNNNMVVDLLTTIKYVRYMKNSQRWLVTDSQSAHGVLGSDGNTIYQLNGRKSGSPDNLINVIVVEIDEQEFEALSKQFSMVRKENQDLRNELGEVKAQLQTQQDLLLEILAKLQ